MSFVFRITEDDILYDANLKSHIGKWAFILCGQINVLSATNYKDANEDYWSIVG